MNRGCYNCGQIVHMRGQCPQMKCTNCGRMGHSERFCRRPKVGARGTPAQQSGAIRADSGMVRPAQAIRSQASSNIAVPGGPSRVFAIDAPVTDGAGPAVVRGTILPAVMRGTILF